MQWTDRAIVLSARKYGENGSLVRLFSQDYGLFAGIVRGGAGSRLRGVYQPGNLVEATWKARLPEHLGMVSAELISSCAALFLEDALRLSALSALLAMAEVCMPERQPEEELFLMVLQLLAQLRNHDDAWQKSYIAFECRLLLELGFRLDLTACAATGEKEGLVYVSPKSGKAVSAAAGEAYRDRLLPLPGFLLDSKAAFTDEDIRNGLQLTGYFLEKHHFHLRPMPQARLRLAELVGRRI